MERYKGALVRDICNARDGVCFLDMPKENINNIVDTVCIILYRREGANLIYFKFFIV